MTTSTMTASPRPSTKHLAWPTVIWLGFLHLGALLALNPAWFSWKALAVCVFMHWLVGGVGICMTYHRLLTHRSFATRPKFLEYVLTAIGCAASEGGPIGWVADHRRHHAHSDENPGDVHTPHEGFLWSHMFWFLTPEEESAHTTEYYNRWAPDLNKDPVLRWLEKYFILFPLLSAATLFAIGGMPFLVWGFFVGSVAVLHSTWLVNSATHVWGYRSHKTRDDSTNLWWVALLTYGEGWHNNHHAYQTSARHGMSWWEIDMTYIALRIGQLCGVVHKLKLPQATKMTRDERVENKNERQEAAAQMRTRPRREEEAELVAAETDR
jgi:fatty-acid desaturase